MTDRIPPPDPTLGKIIRQPESSLRPWRAVDVKAMEGRRFRHQDSAFRWLARRGKIRIHIEESNEPVD